MRTLLLASIALVACSSQARTGDTERVRIPPGARVEASGFLTIEQAPPSPPGPPLPKGPQNELTYYAQVAGVSNAEAAKRLDEQNAIRPEFERLLERLRSSERGNFTEAELVHRPDWAFFLYFKRDPEGTLAKYTRNPRFQARLTPYTEEELQALSRPWIERFERERLFTGYAMNARQGRAEIDMVVSEEEYAEIAAREGWEPVPDYVLLRFDGGPVGSAVDPSVAPGIRLFPQSDRNLGMTNQAALHGRIVLRDGCFKVIGYDGSEKLAYFAREVGLGLDDQGYLSLRTRTAEPRHLGRIGEPFTWAGPIGIAEDAPMVSDLRARCGDAPMMHVGIPDSSAMFNARYGLPSAPVSPPRRPGTR